MPTGVYHRTQAVLDARRLSRPKRYGYAEHYDPETKTSMLLHRHRAEQALGKKLPPKARVHHADGSKSAKSQLVICEDEKYHQMLHRRMAVRAAGGNPNTDKVCSRCKRPKPVVDFGSHRTGTDGLNCYCYSCAATNSKAVRRAIRP